MINIENLSFSYKKTSVFNGINLQFLPGNIYGLLGENGVGKTTLLKLISGLQRPNEGCCRVDDFEAGERAPQFLQDLVFLPDELEVPRGVTPDAYVKLLAPFYPGFAYATFLHLVQELEVDPMRKFSEMSCGQQKKAMIACVLSLGTKYVLLDEPTNGLDIPSKTLFRSILSKRVQDDTTIIISTHQVKDVENLIDPIIILTNDDVLLNASMMEITKRLVFSFDTTQREDALYSELRPGGYLNVCVNREGVESEVDIESLFNTVLRNKKVIKDLFNE